MIRLESARLLFRDHEAGDLEPYCEMESDPIYRWPQPVHPRGELERGFANLCMPKELGLLATVIKRDNIYIGRSGLYPFRNEHDVVQPGEAFIAFYIARPYWRHGFASEAGEAWVRYGFETLDLRRIEAGVAVKNRASQRVVEKLGFQWLRSGGAGDDGGVHWHDFELWNAAL